MAGFTRGLSFYRVSSVKYCCLRALECPPGEDDNDGVVVALLDLAALFPPSLSMTANSPNPVHRACVQERFGKLEGLTFTWVGDGNNVLHDLMLGAAKLGECEM